MAEVMDVSSKANDLEDGESSSEDEDMYGKSMSQALWVDSELLKELEDVDIPVPSSAEEYLAQVRRERRSLPSVVSAGRPATKAEWRPSALDFPFVTLVPAPAGYEPSEEWESSRILQFSNLRDTLETSRKLYAFDKDLFATYDYYQKHKAHFWFKSAFPKDEEEEEEDDDSEAGSDEAVEAKRKAMNSMYVTPMCTVFWPTTDKSVAQRGLTHLDKEPLEAPRELKEHDDPDTCGLAPKVSFLVSMTQVRVRELLEKHLERMRDKGFSHFQGRWLFSLLVALKKPLLAETTSTLRELAKLCSIYRSRLPSKDHGLLPDLNLLICIVARYFDQRDLLEARN